MARTRAVAMSLAILSVLLISTFSFAAAPDRISGPIMVSQTVRVGGGTPMQARHATDIGPVDPSLQLGYITLLTTQTAAQRKAINKLLADQQNPHSASYHKWLTPEQYADRFGLSQNDINKLTGWLQAQGFTIVRTARGRNWIAFSGTAGQVEAVFRTQIHNFKTKDETHFANVTPISIPAALSGIVTGLRGISNFRPKSQARHIAPNYTFPFNGGNYLFIAPGDITTMYDIATLYGSGIDGTGQKLAVAGETGIYQADLTNFRQNFGLSAVSCTVSSGIITACNTSNFKYVLVNGTATEIYGDIDEADLDIEWSGATAKNAQIIYVTANSNTGTTWDSWYYAVDNNVAPVITMSYTAPCELAEADNSVGNSGEGTFSSDEAEFAQANIEGITFMNSAGDTGVAECDYQGSLAEYGYQPAYPASSQYVTGVGGTLIPYTEFTETYWGNSNGTGGGSALSYIPEQAWNDSLEFAYFCEANQSDSFCSGNGVGAGPLLTDWDTMQEIVIGIAAGGGGPSNCVTIDDNGVCQSGFSQPAWQAGLDVNAIAPGAAGMTNNPARFTPDVSLLASANWPGYLVCTEINGQSGGGSSCDSPSSGISDMLTACLNGTGPCTIFGGTSVSSPIFAGMVTLLNQYVVAQGLQATPGLGNFNPTLYSLAANNATNGAFNPVTTPATGSYSNGAFCDPGQPVSGVTGDPWPAALQCPATGTNLIGYNTYDFDATTSYNLAVGLGSVNLSHLAAAMAAVGASTTTTLAPSSENPSYLGDSVTFTATVVTTGSHTPTGTVIFDDNGTQIGSGTLVAAPGVVNSATASFATSTLAVGTHPITAVYGGDSNNAGSTSSALSQQVFAPDFSLTNTGASNVIVLSGQSTTPAYSFSIAPLNGQTVFGGTVTFSCSFSPSDPTLTNSSCTFNPPSIAAGSPASAGANVTVNVATLGPNSNEGRPARIQRHRADNRLPWLPMTLPLAGVVLAGFAGRKRSKYAMVGSLCLALVLAGLLIACGSSSTPIGVSVSGSSSSIYPQNTGWTNSTATFTATVTNDSSNKGVTWSVSAPGSGNPGSIASTDPTHATYTPPTIAPGLTSPITVTATSVADTSKSGNASITLNPTTVPGTYTMTVGVTESTSSHNLAPAPTVTVQ